MIELIINLNLVICVFNENKGESGIKMKRKNIMLLVTVVLAIVLCGAVSATSASGDLPNKKTISISKTSCSFTTECLY